MGPTLHWAAEELRILGVSEDLRARDGALAAPSPDGFKALREGLHAFLDERGESFHHDQMALIRGAFLAAEGEQAFRVWGAR